MVLNRDESNNDKEERIYEYLKKNRDCSYVNEIYIMINIVNIKHSVPSKWEYIRIKVVYILSVILSGLLIAINIPFKNKFKDNNKAIAIARVYREKSKIEKVCNNIQVFEDDIKNGDFTMYRIGSRRYRLSFLIKQYVKSCNEDFYRIKEILKNEDLAPYVSIILKTYAKRIPHTVVFKNSVEYIIKNKKLTTIYIGSTHARFAMICEDLSKKHKKKLVCIPHGVVGTEKIPGGYAGDVFYCSSSEIAIKLNCLYKTTKFLFEDKIVRGMYHIERSNSKFDQKKRVVFFTQPIEVDVTKKIVSDIAERLEAQKEKLYIKIHPLEKSSEYQLKNVEMIDDFEEAIIGNLCISLSSTVLLEALYNKSRSVSIAYLVQKGTALNGRYEFLNDSRILKPKDITSVMNIIEDFHTGKLQ